MAKSISPTKTRRSAASAAQPAAKPKLSASIDYPKAGEAVRPGHYAIRVTATGAGRVQARVGAGAWADCRESVGHFWLDWSPAAGAVVLSARARVGKGRWTAAVKRSVVVA
jgi:hypothetical protein